MTRICPYPTPVAVNQYMALYYRALEPHGFALASPLVYRDSFLAEHGGEFDLIHLQWHHEDLWRCRGSGALAKLKGVAGLWRFLRAAHRMGKRVVWTVHDLEPHDGMGFTDRIGTALLARSADLMICHSEATRERLMTRYFGLRERTVVMRHGNYDGVFPAPRPRAETLGSLGLDPVRPTLVAVGGLRRYKGFDVALAAMEHLGPEFQLVLAGWENRIEPGIGEALQKLADGRANVRLLLRQIGDDELADLYGAADCVLLPYRWITGSGALLTALTLGRGVVCSDLPFFRNELADEPSAGVLVQPGDAAALASGVKEFFASDVPARHAAARRLADRLAWPEVVKPVVARLRELFPAPAAVENAR